MTSKLSRAHALLLESMRTVSMHWSPTEVAVVEDSHKLAEFVYTDFYFHKIPQLSALCGKLAISPVRYFEIPQS